MNRLEMKRPDSVRICGQVWRIQMATDKDRRREGMTTVNYGWTQYREMEIWIDPALNDQQWFLTLLHEAIHIVGEITRAKNPDKEDDVKRLETGLFSFLTENGIDWRRIGDGGSRR